jgi:hypothetical protein
VPFLLLSLVDGFYKNDNTLPLTFGQHFCRANTKIQVFSSRHLVNSNNHRHFHIRFVIRIIFYCTMVIPVNFKIGYEFTLLSCGERVQKRAKIVQQPGTQFDENWSS